MRILLLLIYDSASPPQWGLHRRCNADAVENGGYARQGVTAWVDQPGLQDIDRLPAYSARR